MQCPVNVYYNNELKETMPITISTMNSLYDGIRETIGYSMTRSIPKNAKYNNITVTKKGMIFGIEEVSINKLTDVNNLEKIDVYLISPTGGRSRKSKNRKSRRR